MNRRSGRPPTPSEDIMKLAKKHDNPHRLFLNLVRDLRTIRVCKVVEVFSRCCTACKIQHEVPETLSPAILANHIMKAINDVLEGMIYGKLEVVSDERYPDEQYIVFAWPAANQATSNPLKLISPEESQYFHQLLTEMFAEDNNDRGEISAIKAVNMGADKKLKPDRCQKFLHRLVQDAIFTEHDQRETYSLHPKAIAEFNTVLVNQGYHIPTCPVCRKLIVLRRTATACVECENEIHNMCIYRMVEKSTAGQVPCPGAPATGGRCKHKFDEVFASNIYFDDPIVLDIQAPVVVESDSLAIA